MWPTVDLPCRSLCINNKFHMGVNKPLKDLVRTKKEILRDNTGFFGFEMAIASALF